MSQNGKLHTITLEEHFASESFLEGPGSRLRQQIQETKDHPAVTVGTAEFLEQLCSLGERRIADMDAAGIDMQVLSLTAPGVEQIEAPEAVRIARESNNQLAEAVRRYPGRFAGFAALPTPDPGAAAQELERAVKELGFVGAMINGHARGRYLDDAFFWPILERAEALGVPIYLHPTLPPQPVVAATYVGNYSKELAGMFAMAAWGWHIETANHLLRIILSGAFDRFPALQFMIGHMGETLPFMLGRLDHTLPPQVTKLQRPISGYLRENISYTFSGFNYTQNFLDVLLQVGIERIMFSADYPYSSMAEAHSFLEGLPVSPADRERIAHGNAERLLKL
jgi:predicted TIM-barrel fold metal-dependent hydrolase